MKSTGITRKIDELGRVVLPVELRRTLNISQDDDIEIYVSEGKIHLRKFAPYCIFCGEKENIINYENKNICQDCIKKVSEKFSDTESENAAELNKLRQVLTYKNKEINTLKLDLMELEKHMKQPKKSDNNEIEISDYKDKIDLLNTELSSKEDIIKELQKTINVQKENNEELKSKTDKLYLIIKSHEESIKKEKEEKNQLEKDIKILEQQCKINSLENQIKNNNETDKSSFFSKLFHR